LAGTGIVLFSTAKYGAGLSTDSVAYLDVARSLVSGKGFVIHTGTQVVWWPPLYPMLLAFIQLATELDPASFAQIVNAVLFALVLLLSAGLFQAAFPGNVACSLLGVGTVLLSVPLSDVYAMAWSECLFIPLVLAYLLCAQRYWRRRDALSLAGLTLSAAFACLTRYIGLVLVLCGVLTVMLVSGADFKTRFTRAFAFAGLSLLPLGFWAARNYWLTGTFFGSRGLFRNTFADSINASVETIVSWYASGPALALVVLAAIVVLTMAVLSTRTAIGRLSEGLKVILAGHFPTLLFPVVYFPALLLAATRDATVDSRTLSPIYIPATLVLLMLVFRLLGSPKYAPAAIVRRIPAFLLVLWLCSSLVSVAQLTARRFRNGAGGYSTRTCHESATLACARRMLSSSRVRVYSNYPDVLWAIAGMNSTETPNRTKARPNDLVGRWPAENGSILIWFNNKTWRTWLLSLDELRDAANIEEIARLSDGAIYRISVRDTAAAVRQ